MRFDPVRADRSADAAVPDPLAVATAILRASPQSPLARLLMWREAASAGNARNAALAREAVLRLVGGDADALTTLAFDAVRVGAFTQAEELLDLSGPRHDYETLLTRSALRLEAGDIPTADALRRVAAQAAPVVLSPHAPDAPLILRTRSMEAARYRLRLEDERGFRGSFTGGHFSLDHLLDLPARRLATVNLLDDERALAVAEGPSLLINTIACADRGAAALGAIERFLATNPRLPVINRPEAVARTSRDRAAALFGGLSGARFAAVKRYSRDAADAVLADRVERDFGYPMIVRQVGTHTGATVALVGDRVALLAHLDALAAGVELYVTAFEDVRDAHGVYRKGRAYFVGGKLYPVALLGSDEWQIHSGDRYRIMDRDERLQAEERAYLADPVKALGMRRWSALRAVCAGTRLDFVGVDFAPTAEGVLVFEVNAAMRHNFDHVPTFPYTGPHLQRVSDAFRAMVDAKLR